MKKKFLKFVFIVLAFLIGAAFAIPQMFKDDILRMVEEQANNNLNAKVRLGDVSVSLFRHFPQVTFAVQEVQVNGLGEFEDVPLVHLKELELAFSFAEILQGGKLTVGGVYLIEPLVNIQVLENGVANYDIALESPEDSVEVALSDTTASSNFALTVKEYAVQNATIVYADESMDMSFETRGFNHSGSGDFSLASFDLDTETQSDSVYFEMEGVPYLNWVHLNIDAVMGMNMDKMIFALKENELVLNNLKIGAKGSLTMEEELMGLNFTFNAKENKFADLLSIIPAVFMEGTEGFKISGKFGFSGNLIGDFSETSMPGFNVHLNVDNGRVLVADMPKSINNINLGMQVNAPEGVDYAGMSVQMSSFHAEIGGNPLDMNFSVQNALGDPKIRAAGNGQINLGLIKDVLPLEEGQKLAGEVNFDLATAFLLSDVEAENFDEVKFKGQLDMKRFGFWTSDMPSVEIPNASVVMEPNVIHSNGNMRLGKSDVAWNGDVLNTLLYCFDKAPLKGALTVNSRLMDLNEFLTEGDTTAVQSEAETLEEELEVVRLPTDLDFVLTSSIDKLVFDDLVFTEIKGAVLLADGKLVFDNTAMKSMGGQLKLDGYYAAPEGSDVHEVDLKFKAEKLNIQQTTKSFTTISDLVPLAKNCTGLYGTEMHFKTGLKADYSPDLATIEANGLFEAAELFIEKCEPLNVLAEKLGVKRLAKQSIRDIAMQFEVKDGRVTTKPFPIVLDDDIKGRVEGYSTFDQKINYGMDLRIPTGKLGGEAQVLINQLASQVAKAGGSFVTGDFVNVKVGMEGDYLAPKLKISFPGTEGGVKDVIKENLDAKKQELLNEADKKKQELEDAAKKKMEEEKRKLEEQKKAAEAEAKRKLEEEKQKLKDKAKGKMKDMFGNPK